MYDFLSLFFIFILYSILGYLAEIAFCSLVSKKFVYDRGFLIGPYLPIYGTGAILITLFLGKYHGDIITLFIMSAFYCSVLEYLTSLVMEKIFHLRWWDYSEKKFNLNGRVCLENSFLFGIGGLVIIQVIDPILLNFVYGLSEVTLYILSTILLLIYSADVFLTLKIMFGMKRNVGKLEGKDATDQIKKEVRIFLSKHNYLTTRLIRSFPNMEKINGIEFTKFSSALNSVKSELEKLKKERRRHKN